MASRATSSTGSSTGSRGQALLAGGGEEERLHPVRRCALLADMELDVQRAKELIEQKLAEEEEEEKVGP